MKFFALNCLFFLSFQISSTAQQSNNDPCGCNAVLIDGIYNYRALQGDDDAKMDVLKYISNTSYDEYKKASSAGGGGSYAGFGIEANSEQENYNKKMSQNRSIYKVGTTQKSSIKLLERYGDSAVLQVWQTCKAQCKDPGIQSWIEIQNEKNMVLHFKYISNTGIPAKVVSSNISGGVIVGGLKSTEILLKGTPILAAEHSIQIKRSNPKEPVTIIIHLKGANKDISEFIPGYVEPAKITVQPPIITKATDLDGRFTGYVTINDPLYPGMVTHDRIYPENTVPDNVGWVVQIPVAGRYDLEVFYASDKPRKTDVLINSDKINRALVDRLANVTGGLSPEFAKWNSEGTLNLQKGPVVINFIRENPYGSIPNIKAFKLTFRD